MLRLPAAAGSFYPSDPAELSALISKLTEIENGASLPVQVKACLVPHAGYVYSGRVAGSVFSRIRIPKKILILGVRHRPPGAPLAILSSGAWRTPLGDVPVDEKLAAALLSTCALLREDAVAHSKEHSLEVQLPFLQIMKPGCTIVPIALGPAHFETLVLAGKAIGEALTREKEEVLLLTSSDLNHYEDDATTRRKDHLAIEQLLKMDARALYDTCRNEEISMCGLGPAVAMLTALQALKVTRSKLIRYATSSDRSGDRESAVGYAGMIFS
jgi:AmmeMemoRadiSam system protein B